MRKKKVGKYGLWIFGFALYTLWVLDRIGIIGSSTLIIKFASVGVLYPLVLLNLKKLFSLTESIGEIERSVGRLEERTKRLPTKEEVREIIREEQG